MSSEPLHRRLGLTDDELEAIRSTLGRDPNRTELAMYAAMWSEHCSYKSSKVHLRTLPTEGPRVLVGPGQDAGAVDVGDGIAAVFKIESHSHPSAVEPYQGAATGVGGIVRDVISMGARPVALLDPLRVGPLTERRNPRMLEGVVVCVRDVISMGARPVALLDPLRFGPLTERRNRWLFEGVVAGIGGYGNCIGVPTVGGEVRFAEPHSANPTVNVMCVGLAPAERLVTAAREVREGSLLVLFGAATGRDGIGGVSVLASRTLDEGEARRPSVQIGDPFAGKLLIEASLELVERDLLEGLQDLGGAGLTCAVSESAARAGLGAELDLDAVPLREPDLEAFEILTSESQERMLAIVAPERLDAVRAVCSRWGLATAVVGRLTAGGDLRVRMGGAAVAAVPARSLADDAPVYTRPIAAPPELADPIADDPTFETVTTPPKEAILAILRSPDVADKRWVWEQYDSIVQGSTVLGPGGDAALVRIEGTLRALALATDGGGRFGALDPYLGALHAVAEAARNVACTGAEPLAITNCMNFGNPERPEVMWQFAESVRGVADACRAFGTPVTGGNVSFYNESGDSSIWPTPVIGMLGLIDDYRLGLRHGFAESGAWIYLLGETLAELGGSAFADVVLGVVAGRPPALDLELERRLQRLLVDGARADLFRSAHDCAEGGLAVALAECAIAGATGFAVSLPGDHPPHVGLFSESASRAVVSVAPERASELEDDAAAAGVLCTRLGETGGPRIVFDRLFEVTVDEIAAAYDGAIPELLAG